MTVQNPPANARPGANLTCSESRVAPIVDTVGAVWLGASTIALFVVANRDPEFRVMALPALMTGAGAVIFGFSAAYGYRETGRCRELRGSQTVNASLDAADFHAIATRWPNIR